MITLRAVVDVKEVMGQAIQDFMLNCTDREYQRWWPGMHLAFHTIKSFPGQVGNRVYFDEFIGKHRLKFTAVVTQYIPEKRLVWQMTLWGLRLPGWLEIDFVNTPNGVGITHYHQSWFQGLG